MDQPPVVVRALVDEVAAGFDVAALIAVTAVADLGPERCTLLGDALGLLGVPGFSALAVRAAVAARWIVAAVDVIGASKGWGVVWVGIVALVTFPTYVTLWRMELENRSRSWSRAGVR
jgi:hypothetical protein